MANLVNDLAVVQDQFQLMAIATEMQDENAARLNNNFLALFNEMKKSIAIMSDRVSVLEQEKATADINADTIAKAHLEKDEAQANKIAQLTLKVSESAENIILLQQELLEARKATTALHQKNVDAQTAKEQEAAVKQYLQNQLNGVRHALGC